MSDKILVGPWIRRFLMEHLVAERNLARNTQASYRDTMALLLPFVASRKGKPVDRLPIHDISADMIRIFLLHLEDDRGCSVATRNQRLAAIRALARFIAQRSPECVAWCADVRTIQLKKTSKPVVDYLDKPEIDALIDAPDRRTAQGFRDYVLLLFLYNSGARADEVAHVAIADLDLGRSPFVKLHGKGGKIRLCPLWPLTASDLSPLVAERAPSERVFQNRRKQPITRSGIYALVKRNALKASRQVTSLRSKQVSPHSIRHTCAVHLLRSGVDINTIRAWLGHVSLNTTNIYTEVPLDMKAKALAHCEISAPAQRIKLWRNDKGVMAFLKSL